MPPATASATETPNATTLPDEAYVSITHAVRRLVALGRIPQQDREDVEQDLALHLVQRWDRYDPQRGRPATFIKRCLAARIANLLRDRCRSCRHPGRVSRITDGDDAGDSGMDRFGVNDLAPARADLRQDLALVLGRLSERQRRICALLHRDSPLVIAVRLGRSRSAIYRDLTAIRQACAEAGLDAYLPPVRDVTETTRVSKPMAAGSRPGDPT